MTRLRCVGWGVLLGLIELGADAEAQVAVQSSDVWEYQIEHVAEGVYVIRTLIDRSGFVNGNITFVVGDDGVLVVDSGFVPGAAELAIEAIRERTDLPVLYLVNTHWHGDHWQGNSAFGVAWPNLTVLASEAGYREISTRGVSDAGNFARNYANDVAGMERQIESGLNADGVELTASDLEALSERLQITRYVESQLRTLRPHLATVTFDQRMVVRFGGREVHLLFLGSGNTRGDTVVHLPEEGVLVTGDLIVFPGPYESGSFGPEWRDTLARLAELEFDVLVPGHGEVQRDDRYLLMVWGIMDQVISRVEVLVRHGLTLEEVQARVTFDSLGESFDTNEFWDESNAQLRYFVETGVRRTWNRIAEGD